MIRVLLVDDQTLVRQGVRSLLELTRAIEGSSEEGSIEVVGEADDGVAALEQIAALRPDVVLLDLQMPRLDGIGVLRALQDQPDAPPVLILTTFDDDELVFAGLRAGAKGYLLKDVSLEQLVEAVRDLHAGKTLVQPAVTERVLKNLPRLKDAGSNDAEPLTAREHEVLRLMTGGYSNKEIGRVLTLSEGTVKNHVSSILAKLGVRDRTRAVLKAAELGLI